MIEEKRNSYFWDNVGGSIIFLWLGVPLCVGLVAALIEVGEYLIETHLAATIIIPYIIFKILAVALTIVVPIYIVRYLLRHFGWGISLLIVAGVLVAGFALKEGTAFHNYIESMDEAQRTETSAVRKTYDFIRTKSLPARRIARREQNRTFRRDFRLVKSADAKKLVAERHFAAVMLRDLDWITGNKLHMEENFLKDTAYDIDELVKASEIE